MSENEISIEAIKIMSENIVDAKIRLLELENKRMSAMHGKKYKGLVFQHQKCKRDGIRLRIYAGSSYKKRYYYVGIYKSFKEIFDLCDSIIKGDV